MHLVSVSVAVRHALAELEAESDPPIANDGETEAAHETTQTASQARASLGRSLSGMWRKIVGGIGRQG